MPSWPSAPSRLSRVQRPHGTVPRARSPRGPRPYSRAMPVSTPHSSRNTSRSGATPPTGGPAPVRRGHAGQPAALAQEPQPLRRDPAHARLGVHRPRGARGSDVRALLLGRAQRPLLSRPAAAPQRPAHRPRVDPHAGPLRQPVPTLGQGQVVRLAEHAEERGRHLAADLRLGAAAHPLGGPPSLVTGRRRPAVRRRAADREPPPRASHPLPSPPGPAPAGPSSTIQP